MKFLDEWGVLGNSTGNSAGDSAAVARYACKLKYLVGAAPVVYGIPLYIDHA
jgi:hypothetical protein